MGWDSFYRRRDALNAAIEHASSHSDGGLSKLSGLSLTELPQVRDVFRDEQELALALHHRWTQRLIGYIDTAVEELRTGQSQTADPIDAIVEAWRRAVSAQPALRELLDRYGASAGDALREAVAREHRMLALAAGLAKPSEPEDHITRVGATYAALMHATPERGHRGDPAAAFTRLVTANT